MTRVYLLQMFKITFLCTTIVIIAGIIAWKLMSIKNMPLLLPNVIPIIFMALFYISSHRTNSNTTRKPLQNILYIVSLYLYFYYYEFYMSYIFHISKFSPLFFLLYKVLRVTSVLRILNKAARLYHDNCKYK